MANSIYVSGLSKKTTKDSLVEYFSYYGIVKVLGIEAEEDYAGKKRYWATLSFPEAKSAKRALKDAELHVVDGRHVEVTPAEEGDLPDKPAPAEEQERAGEEEEEEDLPVECDDEEVLQALRKRAREKATKGDAQPPAAKAAKVTKSETPAPATPPDKAAAPKAAEGSPVDAKPEKPLPEKPAAGTDPSTKKPVRVLVSGLSKKIGCTMTSDDLSQYFEYYGVIQKIDVVPGPDPSLCRGLAIVRFELAESVEKVVEEKEKHVVGEKVVKVRPLAGGKDRLLVSGLPPRPKSSAAGVAEYFGKFGEIRTVTMKFKSTSAHAFVHFIDPQVVFNLLKEKSHKLFGSKLSLKAYSTFPPPSRVFVSALPAKSTEKSITKYFAYYGGIESVKLRVNEQMQCAGCSVVIFEDPMTVDAVTKEEEHIIDGRKATVRPFSDKPVKLFINNLSKDTTETMLEEYLSFYGPVDSCRVAKDRETGESRRFAFAEFKDSTHAMVAAKDYDHILDEQTIRIALAERAPGIKLFVGGLNFKTTNHALRAYLSKFGELHECEVRCDRDTGKSRGFAFVEFEDNKSAELALAKEDHELDGKDLKIRQSEPNAERPVKQYQTTWGGSNDAEVTESMLD